MKTETVQRLFRNFSMLVLSRVIEGIFYFGLTVYLARTLGSNSYGKYEFSMAIYVFFSILAASGLDKIGTREIAKARSAPGGGITSLVGELALGRLLTSFAAFSLLCVTAFLIPKPLDVKSLIVLNGVVLLFSFISLEWFFMGMERMEFMAANRIIKSLCFLVLGILLVRGSGDVIKVPIARIVSVLFGVCFMLYVYLKGWHSFAFKFDPTRFGYLLKSSFPLLFAGMMTELYIRFDTVMLSFMRSDREVGFYAAAYRIILFLIGLRAIGLNAVFPSLVNFFTNSKKEFEGLIHLSQKAAVMFSIPIGVGGMILAPKIMRLVFGQPYAEGAIALQVLSLSFAIMGSNFIFPQLQIAADRQFSYMKIIIFGVLLNIAMNLVLIPKYGILGAALATVGADISSFVLFYAGSREFIKVDMIKLAAKPFISAALMGCFLVFFGDLGVVRAILSGGFLYMALLFVLKYVKKEELVLLKEAAFPK